MWPFSMQVCAGDFALASRHRRCVAISFLAGCLNSCRYLDGLAFVDCLDFANPFTSRGASL
jgi:hypothetical protein